MLLFIRKIEFIPIGFKHFNTSHVTVYRSTIYINVTIYTDFNTSHVTVYHHKLLPFCPIFSFQYISCYCLSTKATEMLHMWQDFNTSHVTVYLLRLCLCSFFLCISIHLMLLFIQSEIHDKYKKKNFNTSHVTVYLFRHLWLRIHCRFQYISCYCLSPSSKPLFPAVQSFQYISCYCLSLSRFTSESCSANFNTSHVTVYRYAWTYRHICKRISIHLMLLFITTTNQKGKVFRDFNTSHVTVYHMLRNPDNAHQCISIHLMLLFINTEVGEESIILQFQYISCYCLSAHLLP